MGNMWSSSTGDTQSEIPEREIPPPAETQDTREEKFGEEEMEDFYERRRREREAEMERFSRDLAAKRKARQEALGCLGREMKALREERGRREEAERQLEAARAGTGVAELEDLRERVKRTEELENQVKALKDVANIGKQILAIREKQVNELNAKLKVLEETGAEYEKEVESVKRLRELYEERERAREAEQSVQLERERARTSVAETRLALVRQEAREATVASARLTETNEELTEKVESLDKRLEEARAEISELRVELATRGEEAYKARSQLELVNGLFSGVLTGRSQELDRLTRLLEENRPLLVDLTAKGRIDQVASVLMDVATPHQDTEDEEIQPPTDDIAHNLTKVWRVMIELLSHHKSSGGDGVPESCYKSVETPKGTRLVISPSQTFIRLKDLILEKNCLVKEVGRLKVLNGHLETRLDEQEKRLSLVTSELHKTWGVVNKLRTQHKQLHTQEKILRYELQHKRHMLTELKKELEICREQWEMARIKNSQTEEDWKLLREEFASRKRQGGAESTESGFEDEADSLGSEGPEEEESAEPAREPNMQERLEQAEEDVLHEIVSAHQVLPDTQPPEEVSDEKGEPGVSPEEGSTEEDEYSILATIDDTVPPVKENVLEVVPEVTTEEENEEGASEELDETTALLRLDGSPSESLEGSPEERETAEVRADTVARPPTAEEGPSTSSQVEEPPKRPRTTEEIFQARDERLKRLEEQCKSLFTKMSNTSVRSGVISSKLEELHQHYGESDSPDRTSPPTVVVTEPQEDATESPPSTETSPTQTETNSNPS